MPETVDVPKLLTLATHRFNIVADEVMEKPGLAPRLPLGPQVQNRLWTVRFCAAHCELVVLGSQGGSFLEESRHVSKFRFILAGR